MKRGTMIMSPWNQRRGEEDARRRTVERTRTTRSSSIAQSSRLAVAGRCDRTPRGINGPNLRGLVTSNLSKAIHIAKSEILKVFWLELTRVIEFKIARTIQRCNWFESPR